MYKMCTSVPYLFDLARRLVMGFSDLLNSQYLWLVAIVFLMLIYVTIDFDRGMRRRRRAMENERKNEEN